MKHDELNREYAPKAAQSTLQRYARQEQRINEERRKQATPLTSQDDLSSAVQRLAETWGATTRPARKG